VETLTWLLDGVLYLADVFLHLNVHLKEIIAQYGGWTYAILFGVVFCETGLVVTPFLPGDSLLFAAGAFAGDGAFALAPLMATLMTAAVLGDAVNYAIGKRLGPRVLTGRSRFLKKEYLDRTHRFYERYGGKTIIIARFVPIVRTFAPFLAGVGSMSYAKFAAYNVVGAMLWVSVCCLGGYCFGSLEFVKKNFSLVIMMIIAISILPAAIEIYRERRRGEAARPSPDTNAGVDARPSTDPGTA